ncbi:PREDICTED: uncharacterized protein LOC104818407 isoform X1 [Tarenaya hassleriana]|uniref:uncharacterized protein LOC104818407 isoform X1 n=1 Tax=Tarenaya hassleriana TaxID=28532 RepID=UPI00053C5C55|nr:PREDICTED: uncharacterized protein LOC104818407 isoform X1 [Tarenaya hassleriana]
MEEVFGSSWFPVRGGDFPVGEIGRSLRSTGNELTPQISSVFEVNSKARHALQCGNAFRLSDRIRQRIMQMEKNGINKEGELSANQNYNTEVSFCVIIRTGEDYPCNRICTSTSSTRTEEEEEEDCKDVGVGTYLVNVLKLPNL